MIVIPAIDILEGRCTRLLRGQFDHRSTYATDPLALARRYEAAGLSRLHLVDLDGVQEGAPKNLRLLERLARQTRLQIDFGGGIRNEAHIRAALEAGASQVNLGTWLWGAGRPAAGLLERFGSERLIASIDVSRGKVAVRGWQEQTRLSAMTAIGMLHKMGWMYFSVTDVERDGTMEGPDPAFYRPLTAAFPNARIIGGGGVASRAHLHAMKQCGLHAAITGKALLEGSIRLDLLAKDAELFAAHTAQKRQTC